MPAALVVVLPLLVVAEFVCQLQADICDSTRNQKYRSDNGESRFYKWAEVIIVVHGNIPFGRYRLILYSFFTYLSTEIRACHTFAASGKIQKYKLREMAVDMLDLHDAASVETA